MRILPPLHPTDADFAAIRRRDGFYVDKTGLFRDLLEADPSPLSSSPLTTRHQFLARPRRFGKTLLINTLEAWFQGCRRVTGPIPKATPSPWRACPRAGLRRRGCGRAWMPRTGMERMAGIP